MGLLQTLGKALDTACNQFTQPSSKAVKAFHFTTNFQRKAKACGTTENDALDVFYHGSLVKENMMVRKYNGYELGIWVFMDRLTGQISITSIWKRARR